MSKCGSVGGDSPKRLSQRQTCAVAHRPSAVYIEVCSKVLLSSDRNEAVSLLQMLGLLMRSSPTPHRNLHVHFFCLCSCSEFFHVSNQSFCHRKGAPKQRPAPPGLFALMSLLSIFFDASGVLLDNRDSTRATVRHMENLVNVTNGDPTVVPGLHIELLLQNGSAVLSTFSSLRNSEACFSQDAPCVVSLRKVTGRHREWSTRRIGLSWSATHEHSVLRGPCQQEYLCQESVSRFRPGRNNVPHLLS